MTAPSGSKVTTSNVRSARPRPVGRRRAERRARSLHGGLPRRLGRRAPDLRARSRFTTTTGRVVEQVDAADEESFVASSPRPPRSGARRWPCGDRPDARAAASTAGHMTRTSRSRSVGFAAGLIVMVAVARDRRRRPDPEPGRHTRSRPARGLGPAGHQLLTQVAAVAVAGFLLAAVFLLPTTQGRGRGPVSVGGVAGLALGRRVVGGERWCCSCSRSATCSPGRSDGLSFSLISSLAIEASLGRALLVQALAAAVIAAVCRWTIGGAPARRPARLRSGRPAAGVTHRPRGVVRVARPRHDEPVPARRRRGALVGRAARTGLGGAARQQATAGCSRTVLGHGGVGLRRRRRLWRGQRLGPPGRLGRRVRLVLRPPRRRQDGSTRPARGRRLDAASPHRCRRPRLPRPGHHRAHDHGRDHRAGRGARPHADAGERRRHDSRRGAHRRADARRRRPSSACCGAGSPPASHSPWSASASRSM